MPVLESATARLMLAVLTVAIGLVTMRSQSDFWLGVLSATAAAWLVLALGALVGTRGSRRRPVWMTFLAVAVAGLVLGFGPWSDSSVRGSIPEDATTMTTYL